MEETMLSVFAYERDKQMATGMCLKFGIRVGNRLGVARRLLCKRSLPRRSDLSSILKITIEKDL